MCKIMEESNKEYARQQAYQIAMNLLRMGILTDEDIAKATNLSFEVVEELAKMVKTSA